MGGTSIVSVSHQTQTYVREREKANSGHAKKRRLYNTLRRNDNTKRIITVEKKRE
jgi:hypothetical protein